MAKVIINQAELEKALADPQRILLIVMGNDQGMAEVAQNADNAILHPETQAALWVQDLSLLTAQQRSDYQGGDPENVACALSLPQRQVRARIPRAKALSLYFMNAVKAAEKHAQ